MSQLRLTYLFFDKRFDHLVAKIVHGLHLGRFKSQLSHLRTFPCCWPVNLDFNDLTFNDFRLLSVVKCNLESASTRLYRAMIYFIRTPIDFLKA